MLSLSLFIVSVILTATVYTNPVPDYLFDAGSQSIENSSASNEQVIKESDGDSSDRNSNFQLDTPNEIAHYPLTGMKDWSADGDLKIYGEHIELPVDQSSQQTPEFFQAGPEAYAPDLPIFDRNILLKMREQQRQFQIKARTA